MTSEAEVVKVPVSDSSEAEQVEERPAHLETIEELKQQVEEYKDHWLRAQAEVENTRKWAERHAEERVQAERERLLRSFLTVADNLERALASDAEGNVLRQGVEVTYQDLLQLFAREGVTPMEDLVGKSFDPWYHEAIATVPSSDTEEGKIVDEVQKGYLLEGRPLRPARVVVSRSSAD